MKSNSVYAFFFIAFASACLAQTPSDRASLSSFAPHPSNISETDRPVTLHVLTLRLNDSFQLVAQSRDQKGFVHDRAALKEHTANLKAFRKALKRKDLPAANTTNSQLQNISHLLRDTMESFFAFEQANDQPDNPNIYVTMGVRESFAAHSKNLDQLTVAVKQAEANQSQSTASSTE
jgi:hypothetical protein